MRVTKRQDEGFMLVGLIVAIFLILLALSIAAPKVARSLRREREIEAVHRGNQYVRAIRLYYKKFGHYPGTIEQLETTNNIRFLRRKYVDPMTGKPDWRIIKVGEQKTTVKGFFGQPLAGIASAGLGSAAGMASAGAIGAGAAGPSSSSGSSFGSSSFGSSSSGSGSGAAGASTATGTSGTSTDGSSTSSGTGSSFGSSSTVGSSSAFGASSTSSSAGGMSSQSATSFTGGGAPFLGVGLPVAGDSVITVNEQTTYPTWEFLYDPRIEQLYAKASLFGGGPPSVSAGSLGSASSMSSGFGAATGATGSTGPGTTTGTGTGTTTGTGTGTTGTSGNPPQ